MTRPPRRDWPFAKTDVARFFAPAKIVLAGEYAVTDGYSAVVAALTLRAAATRTLGDVDFAAIEALDGTVYPYDELSFDREPLLFSVVEQTMRAGVDPVAMHYAVDTHAFYVDKQKVGIGSSSAACVALTAALTCRSDFIDVDGLFVNALAAHRKFQGGGSGIDIAAACYGGIVRFHLDTQAQTGARIEKQKGIPNGLSLLVVRAGGPVSTMGFVAKYQSLPNRADHALALADAASAFCRALDVQDASALLRAVDKASVAMDAMGAAAKIDVVTESHKHLMTFAKRAGGAAKPSGAGGGDVAICVIPSENRARFIAALDARFQLLDAEISPLGVTATRP